MTLFAGTLFCTAFTSNECVCLFLLVLLGMLWQVESDSQDHLKTTPCKLNEPEVLMLISSWCEMLGVESGSCGSVGCQSRQWSDLGLCPSAWFKCKRDVGCTKAQSMRCLIYLR